MLNSGADAVTTTVSLARLGLSSQSRDRRVLNIDSAIDIPLDSHVAKVYRIVLRPPYRDGFQYSVWSLYDCFY
ncbi:hypothetical protein VN97_g9685 [Penicillium thymicola]|uniref:Uncharacterized protein n=1 Tax=Penicillium thymicola TaxID=293382 RepID=A0AAI9X4T2_PENTH|nr:hypothetical protein VN97_g9685 [Penicillium thymicola]